MRANVHAEKYQKHAARASERQKRLSEEGREIAPLPECADPALVDSCRLDLLKFMLTFGNSSASPAFPSPFSDAQLYAIHVVQETLLHGGSRPLCLPRGFGKSTICEWGIAWALAYGHQHFILIIAAKTALASQILENVKCIIRQNELFQSCFPALCYPIERLENSPGRAPGQLLNGEHTNIKINSQILICPTVPGAPSSGAIVTTSGLDSAVRGLKVGSSRPTAVIIDDPQTERSADEYAAVPGEIKAVAAQFGKEVLTQIDEKDFYARIPELRKACGDRAVMRCIHFYQENARVPKQVEALEKGDFESFLQLIKESGRSSWMYLQNVIPAGYKQHQDVAVALGIAEHYLNGRGAYRVHGGGFAGTIQAFVPMDILPEFVAGMDAALGQGACHVLSIRPQGGVEAFVEE